MKAKTKRMCALVVGALAAGMSQPAGATVSPAGANASSAVVLQLQESVKKNGGRIWALSRRIGELRLEMNSLPERSWFTECFGLSDKRSHKALMEPYIPWLRDALLRGNGRGQPVDFAYAADNLYKTLTLADEAPSLLSDTALQFSALTKRLTAGSAN